MSLPEYVKGMLSGVRVVDLTRVLAGPFGTLLMSDLGAQVIKVEEPNGGDTTRQIGQEESEGITPYFMSVNRNKLSVTLNLTRPEGRELLHGLVAEADVVISNYRPTVLEKLGCDYAALKAANPRVIHCALSGFGQTGPYRDRAAYDLIVQGMGGGVDLTGYADGEPAVMGLHVGDQTGGMFAAFSIASALYRRERTGEGADIDISLLDCQVSLLAFLGQTYLSQETVARRSGTAHPVAAPFKGFKTRDGYITVVAHRPKHWEALCGVLGTQTLMEDQRFGTVNDRVANKDELYPLLDPLFLRETTAHWLEALAGVGIACGPVNRIDETLSDEQVLERNMVVDRSDAFGDYRIVGNPVKTDAQEDGQFGPPPRLGEHTDLVLSELLGKSQADIDGLRAAGIV